VIIAIGLFLLVFVWFVYTQFFSTVKVNVYVKVPQGIPSFVPLGDSCTLDVKSVERTKVVRSGDGVIIESELPVGSKFSFKARCGRYLKNVKVEVTANTYSYSTFRISAVASRWPPSEKAMSTLIVSYDCNCQPKVRASGLWIFSIRNFKGGVAVGVMGNDGYVEVDLYEGSKLIAVLKKFTYTDKDKDGLSSYLEKVVGSSDEKADTDGDGLNDYKEFLLGTDPRNPDTDGNGLSDYK